MQIDDRLATVLRAPASGERAARTQFRQLLDLLGSASKDDPGELTSSAYARLAVLAENIPAEEQSRILREPGLRLRNARLVQFLAEGDNKPAAAALATARLSDEDWQAIIPEMPIVARGFLRHRRDLPPGAKRLLDRLGVRDLVLPEPQPGKASAPSPGQEPAAATETANGGIRSILQRIEAFREGRKDTPPAPRLPLGDTPDEGQSLPVASFEFSCDVDGRVTWASSDIAPRVVGMRLAGPSAGAVAVLDPPAATAMRQLQPLRAARLRISAGSEIDGEWRIDAAPAFTGSRRQFSGYRGRFRRPVYTRPPEEAASQDSAADRMRQLLHELRTPVNAIQGFAEIIQQQLFGHAPNEYRALAAAVSVDAAKLLAAFDELDRLSKLETQAIEIEQGDGDLREVVVETIRRLDGALRSRNSGFDLTVTGSPFNTGIAREELMLTGWRLFASLAGALAPDERIDVQLEGDGEAIRLSAGLPQAIAEKQDPLAIVVDSTRPAISAGMFGTGFALRLAKAEIAASGGTFTVDEQHIVIDLPLLTALPGEHSTGSGGRDAAGA